MTTGYSELRNELVSAANGVDYAYRDTGGSGVPLVLLQHFRGNLDNWDPALVDALAADRRVVTFDNVGVGATTGSTPNTVEVGFDSLVNFHTNARPDLSNPAAPLDMLGIDGGNLFAGFTPGVIYDFVCATTTFGPCPSGPASDYHFIVPAQTLNSAGLIVGTFALTHPR